MTIEGWINGSHDHKKTYKALINNDTTFKEFTKGALAMPSNVKIGLRLWKPSNPKDDMDNNVHLYNLYNHDSQLGGSQSDDSEEGDESDCNVSIPLVFYFPDFIPCLRSHCLVC